MRSLAATLALACLAFAACTDKDPGDPGDANGGVPLVVGEYCASTTPTATLDGTTWRVTLAENTTTYRDVAGTDGIVRRQTVRGCVSRSCTLVNASNLSAQQAIAFCQNA